MKYPRIIRTLEISLTGNMANKRVWFGYTLAQIIVSLVAIPAFANLGGVMSRPNAVSGPLFGGPTNLVVEKEKLVFECSAHRGDISCDFEARYTIHNPTDQTESVLGAFYGIECSDVSITSGGKDIARALSFEEMNAIDEAVKAVSSEPEGKLPAILGRIHHIETVIETAESRGKLSEEQKLEFLRSYRFGMTLTVAAGASRVVVAKGTIQAGKHWRYGLAAYDPVAVRGRHLLMATRHYLRSQDIIYQLSPIKTWAEVHDVEIEVRYLESLSLVGTRFLSNGEKSRVSNIPSSNKGWTKSSKQNRTVATWKKTDEIGDYLLLSFEEEEPILYNGGIMLRIGGTFGDARGLRLGLGYEVAAPKWLFYSINVESDASSYLAVVPLVKACSPWVLFIPSASIGLGVPMLIRFDEEFTAGIRLQTDLHWGPIGIVLPLDFYPALDSWFQISLLGQISF
ncbi:MAG: hypothetical protein GY854_17985 [Deltaproteobacteria bacterium]|nr:hypothetical protein [Deltaproteobacteria bacterium]